MPTDYQRMKRKEEILDALMEELDSHLYVRDNSGFVVCYHASHVYNTPTGKRIPTSSCWRAAAVDFIRGLHCDAEITISQAGVVCVVTCQRRHRESDEDKEHEGVLPRIDNMEGEPLRDSSLIRWR